jgi:hypothetical protein
MSSRFWQDFNSENDWQLPDVAPWQLPKLLAYPIVDHSERARAEWMWRSSASYPSSFGLALNDSVVGLLRSGAKLRFIRK